MDINVKRCELVGHTVSCLLSPTCGLLPNELNKELTELGYRLILEQTVLHGRQSMLKQLKGLFNHG